ncbi:MAG: MBL fold metallo-hydrolase [Bacteroidales bacterium]|nr:MBL fold metallo-hydrolase [Bacteroidales bacterium]
MHFKIHRGTHEIGGSCVEIWTETTRILVDFGMPLVQKDGSEFDIRKYKNLSRDELIKAGVLPYVKGIYDDEDLIDGIIISHPHQDHYGLFSYINPAIKCYLGKATHKLIEISNTFTPQDITIPNPVYYEREKPFSIGDITITPYWADHSAFDSYSLLIESGGKNIFYSGDFRGHGRKAGVFKWFTHNAPKNVDFLLLEGTSIGRSPKSFRSEWNIEYDLVKTFSNPGRINVVYASGQNIDRIVSVYKACKRTGKIMVVDIYVATILKEISEFGGTPYPSKAFENIKVIFSYYTSKKLADQGNEKMLYRFKSYKIKKEEISTQPDKYVMLIRPSMQKDIEHIKGIYGGNFIYSMWEGYKFKPGTKKFLEYFRSKGFSFYNIHTSGHADIETLKKMVKAVKPKYIVPIHTFSSGEYKNIFIGKVVELKDGEIKSIF